MLHTHQQTAGNCGSHLPNSIDCRFREREHGGHSLDKARSVVLPSQDPSWHLSQVLRVTAVGQCPLLSALSHKAPPPARST